MERGYIKLWRKLADSKLWELSPDHLRVAICLLSSNSEGRVLLSLSQIAEDCSYYENRKTRQLSKQKVFRIMSDLKTVGFLSDNLDANVTDNLDASVTQIHPCYHWLLCDSDKDNSDARVTAIADANVTPKPTPKKKAAPKQTVRETRAVPYSDSFEAFWELYPRRSGKGYAWECWQKIGSSKAASVSVIMAGLNAQIDAKHFPDELKMIPMPSTWLNQRRWEDEAKSHETRPKSYPNCPAGMVPYEFGGTFKRPGNAADEAAFRKAVC